jgi:hypothetical protein
VVSYAAYLDDCAARTATAAHTFRTDARGFTAGITTQEAELVFFAVPYNDGWQATVNGRPATVEKVDCGLCAVRVDAGESTIRFDYRAIGQKTGGRITLVCAALWAIYAVLLCILRRRTGRTAPAAYTLTAAQEFAALPHWCKPKPLPESETLSETESLTESESLFENTPLPESDPLPAAPACPENSGAAQAPTASPETPPADGE